MNVFYLGKNVKEAVDAPRVHHQLFPMNLFYEDGTTTVSYRVVMGILLGPLHAARRVVTRRVWDHRGE